MKIDWISVIVYTIMFTFGGLFWWAIVKRVISIMSQTI